MYAAILSASADPLLLCSAVLTTSAAFTVSESNLLLTLFVMLCVPWQNASAQLGVFRPPLGNTDVHSFSPQRPHPEPISQADHTWWVEKGGFGTPGHPTSAVHLNLLYYCYLGMM